MRVPPSGLHRRFLLARQPPLHLHQVLGSPAYVSLRREPEAEVRPHHDSKLTTRGACHHRASKRPAKRDKRWRPNESNMSSTAASLPSGRSLSSTKSSAVASTSKS